MGKSVLGWYIKEKGEDNIKSESWKESWKGKRSKKINYKIWNRDIKEKRNYK